MHALSLSVIFVFCIFSTKAAKAYVLVTDILTSKIFMNSCAVLGLKLNPKVNLQNSVYGFAKAETTEIVLSKKT